MAENYRRALTEEEIPSAFKNVYGDRTKKPMSVQMAGLGTEVLTPIGTINDIYAELEKEDPSYVKIAGLAGLELLGTAAPVIEMAAKSGNKGLIQKAIDAWKKNEAENPPLDPNSVEAIEVGLDKKILFDDLDELTDAEKAEIQMEKLGPSDNQLKQMADELNFSYDDDIQKAYDKKIINKEEYLDNKYVLYSKKQAEYIKNPPDVNDLDAVIEKEFINNYLNLFNYFDKKELLKVITEFPDDKDFLHTDYTKNILKPMANTANMPLSEFYETIEKLSREIGTTGQGLTTRPLPRARYSGDKVPEKPFLPTDSMGRIDEYELPKEQRAALLRGNNLGFKDVVYHSSENVEGGFAKEFNQFLTPDQKWIADGNNNFDNLTVGTLHDFLGTHVGTARAAAERSSRAVRNRGGFTMELKARLDKPATFDVLVKESGVDIRNVKPEEIVSESDLRTILEQAVDDQYPKKIRTNEDRLNAVKTFRRRLAEKGYTHVPYINDVEDPTSISYIMLTDRPADSAAVLRDMRAEFDPDKITSPDLRMAEGGPLMNKQMEMAFMKQGGIKDDGMTKDPVSGNTIPPGSMAKEVRDDIPAMLSEGEYVVPADVLRYYGVNFFENLRGQAKQGLQNMEQNGRIGGTPMTQQDVARNMQQPMAAAQGAMMQSPIRIQQQPAPQAMGNTMQQNQAVATGYPHGGYHAPQSNLNLANLMGKASFQNTSSYQQNVAKAQEEAAQAAPISNTYMRTHYNKQGQTAQIPYIGETPETAVPDTNNPTVAQLLKDYPLTESEWLAYQKSQQGGGGGGGGDTTPTGSDTSWMDGINWADQASVKEWVESPEGLGMSEAARTIAEKGGILGAIPQGIQAQDIAKARGIRDYYESIGDTEMVNYLDGKLKETMKNPGFLISALDKLGLMTGKNYLNQMQNLTAVEQQNIKFGGMSTEEKEKLDTQLLKDKEDRQTAAGEAAKAAQAFKESDDYQKMIDKSKDPEDTEANLKKVIAGLQSGAETGTIQLNEGGLMSSKPKKKRGRPKKSGLAGKK